MAFGGVQMDGSAAAGRPDAALLPLGPDDVPEMIDLVKRTEPGPFRQRTIEMGTYLGVREGGQLVAMAGQRMHPTGWVEISAVCTDPAHRGQGLGGRLVRALVAEITARGERPFLHATDTNTNAIRLYEALGFTIRTTLTFSAVARATP